MVFGADPIALVRIVLGHGITITVAGAALGTAAFALTCVLSASLYQGA